MPVGAGIGSISIAPVVQNIPGDLFASLSVAPDRLFLVDDLIEPEQSSR